MRQYDPFMDAWRTFGYSSSKRAVLCKLNLSPNSPKKPPPLGGGRSRRVKPYFSRRFSQKSLKTSLKMVQFKQRENRFRHSSKALVEKCGNVGMTCVERGAVMPLMFCLPKGDGRSRPSLEPRVAQKRVGWDKPPSLDVGCMTFVMGFEAMGQNCALGTTGRIFFFLIDQRKIFLATIQSLLKQNASSPTFSLAYQETPTQRRKKLYNKYIN